MKRISVRIAAAALGLTIATSEAARRPVKVRVEFEPTQSRVLRFDRVNGRPPEIGGKAGDMTAVTLPNTQFTYSYTYDTFTPDCRPGERRRTQIRVTSFRIFGRQSVTVHIPNDAGKDLEQHENGHYQLHLFAYSRAESQANEMCRRMIDRTFEGCDDGEARSKLDAYFGQEFSNPYFRWLNEIQTAFDGLTNHGLNANITAQQAVKQVISERGGGYTQAMRIPIF